MTLAELTFWDACLWIIGIRIILAACTLVFALICGILGIDVDRVNI